MYSKLTCRKVPACRGRRSRKKKGGGLRSRYAIRQYAAEAWNEDVFSVTPGWVCVRVLFTIARSSQQLSATSTWLSCRERTHLRGTTARMGKGEECCVEAAQGTERLSTSQPLLFQNFLLGILTEKLEFKKVASTPTVMYHTDTNVKMLVHVDDPL